MERVRQKIRKAREHGWSGACRRLVNELRDVVPLVQEQLLHLHARLKAQETIKKVPLPIDLYQDILVLDQDFEKVTWQPEIEELSVKTDPIVLKGIDLGPFEIRLEIGSLDRPQPYRVEALDSNPAAVNEDVTHPHIQDEVLCEGEGRTAIRAVLREGRLLDFFTVVSQVLHTYNNQVRT